jgi:hypothetical protein
VARAHGLRTELAASHWLCRESMPPFYPNLVTLSDSPAALGGVRELRAGRAPGWAVKDSFHCLPLADSGFRPLFDAEWLASPGVRVTGARSLRWSRVASDSELAAWEAAWGESAGQGRVFRAELLARKEIAVLAGVDALGAIAAGVIANRSGDCVGLSNFFARGERERLRAESCDAARSELAGSCLVGYESGDDLVECRALGFESLGSLRVWLAQE